MAIIALLFFVLIGRFVQLQIFDAAWLEEKGQKQWTRTVVSPAHRGKIVDSTGKALAQSATTYTVSVSPKQVVNNGAADALADIFAEYLGVDRAETYARITNTERSYAVVQRQVERETVEALKALRSEHASRIADEKRAKLQSTPNPLIGVSYEEDFRRYYPLGQTMAQMLGIISADGVGQSGLEAQYDSELAGQNGLIQIEVDGSGREVAENSVLVESVPGKDIHLTTNYVMQSYAEKAAGECIEKTGAANVTCLIMDVRTGGLLAQVVYPDFDPNAPPREDSKLLTSVMRNRAISESYEPGALAGLFTLAKAMDEGVDGLDEGYACAGSVWVEDKSFPCWCEEHETEDRADAIFESCNTALAGTALSLDKEEFYAALRDFGFGEKSGIDLPGEVGGSIVESKYAGAEDIAAMGQGENLLCSPLQLISAVGAVANEGRRMQPYIVEKITDAQGNILQENQPIVSSTPVSASTSVALQAEMFDFVEKGKGSNARVAGYSVGGAGGNGRKYIDGKVSAGEQVSMFCAVAPMESPQIAVLFIVETENAESDYAFTRTAPYVADILSQALPYLGIAPRSDDELEADTAMPSLAGAKLEDAEANLRAMGLRVLADNNKGTVRAQLPEAGEMLRDGDTVLLLTKEYQTGNVGSYQISVPDILDKSVLKANALLKKAGLFLEVQGVGKATAQSPAAGSIVEAGSVVTGIFSVEEDDPETSPTATPDEDTEDTE